MNATTAFTAAQMALLSMAARAVFASEAEDGDVGALMVEVDADGATFTLLDKQGRPMGGGTL
ncbi:MAG TPA: hypothetical protein VLF15_05710 [Pseudoxanthomonas sp.]|nr:hypothetical protein [Pseudoxanthomonas sp.]